MLNDINGTDPIYKSSTNGNITELDDGNIYRKAPDLMGNSMVSC